jgi:ureidoglycolate dehydrogenase (NAD+)
MSLPYDEFTARVDRLVDQIHASPPAPGVDRVLVPGERGYRTARERARTGIPLTKRRAETLWTLAGELGIAPWLPQAGGSKSCLVVAA